MDTILPSGKNSIASKSGTADAGSGLVSGPFVGTVGGLIGMDVGNTGLLRTAPRKQGKSCRRYHLHFWRITTASTMPGAS